MLKYPKYQHYCFTFSEKFGFFSSHQSSEPPLKLPWELIIHYGGMIPPCSTPQSTSVSVPDMTICE